MEMGDENGVGNESRNGTGSMTARLLPRPIQPAHLLPYHSFIMMHETQTSKKVGTFYDPVARSLP